jgi:DNA-binding MarR family transcriptional regulator
MAMARERLSHLQRRILAWLQAHEQRYKGSMSASYAELVQALGHEKGNLSHSLANLEAKGLVRLTRTPGSQAQAIDLTPEGRTRAAHLAGSCD